MISYLGDQEAYVTSEYPAVLFYRHLEEFINEHAKDEGYTPSDEQLELLWHVAEDSIGILDGHIDILDIGAVKSNESFISAVNRSYRIKRGMWLYLGIMIIIIAAMIFFRRTNRRKPLLYILTSIWICSVIYLIPSIVFYISSIPSRLAIVTPYISHAVKGLADGLTIIYSAVLFIISTTGLIISAERTSM